jgi:hypothetical protein
VPQPTTKKTRGQLAQGANNPPPEEDQDHEDSDAIIEEAVDFDRMPELDDGPKKNPRSKMKQSQN